MSRSISAALAAALLLPQVAAAGEVPDQGVPCVGPMCMLTPIYKLGTMMPDMPGSSEPPKTPSAPSTTSSQAQPASANPPSSEAEFTTTAAPQQEPDRGEANAAKGEVGNKDNTRPQESRSLRHAGGHVARRSVPQRARSTGQVAHRSGDTPTNTPVTIAADVTETDRLLRMASMVTSPRIQVVTSTPVGGCRQKPDFVVDTMSNPDRVGPAIPLFTEGLIIVARKDIQDLAGLKGRQVSFGTAGSSSQRIAQRVFRSLKIDVHEQTLDLDNAFDGLTLGSVDAVAFLTPEGFGGMAHHDPQLHLLSVPDQIPPLGGLKVTRIDPASYLEGLWSSSSINVVSVDAVLSPSRVARMQPNAQAVFAALDQRAPDLAANGFNLIGGSGGLTTMRSSAKDDTRVPASASIGPGC